MSKEYEIKTMKQEQCLQLKCCFCRFINWKLLFSGNKNLVGVIFLCWSGGGRGDEQIFDWWAGDSTVWKPLLCAIFGFTWSTIVVFMILQKPHVLGKSFSSYIRKWSRPIRLQDFLSFNITKLIWGIKFIFWMFLSVHGSYSLIM